MERDGLSGLLIEQIKQVRRRHRAFLTLQREPEVISLCMAIGFFTTLACVRQRA
jgi:hypothetical protein